VNVARSYVSTQELLNVFLEGDCQIALVSEPYVGSSNVVRQMKGVKVYQFTDGPRVKACIFVKPEVTSSIGLTQHSTPNLAVIKLNIDNRSLILASGYIEPDVDVSDTMTSIDSLAHSHKGSQLIIGMDGNGAHTSWGCKEANERGNLIMDMCS